MTIELFTARELAADDLEETITPIFDAPAPRLHDCAPHISQMYEDVAAGLGARQKSLPCKYFYDERGSQLFDAICELGEYYQTRTEGAILADNIAEIGERLGADCRLVEYGSGSSTKTRTLLDHVAGLRVYVPVDISRAHLDATACRLARDYPELIVMPVCADYTQPFSLPPAPCALGRTAVFFPGSTIGNFEPAQARDFLATIARAASPGGGLLIGVDLKKDPAVLHAAYNDAAGVTADFNLNVLRHINRELDADFDLDAFSHCAFYNAPLGRIEMHLVSLRAQTVTVGPRAFRFAEGETIHTECSYKYTLAEFAALAAGAGLTVEQVWTDPATLFSVQWLTAA